MGTAFEHSIYYLLVLRNADIFFQYHLDELEDGFGRCIDKLYWAFLEAYLDVAFDGGCYARQELLDYLLDLVRKFICPIYISSSESDRKKVETSGRTCSDN